MASTGQAANACLEKLHNSDTNVSHLAKGIYCDFNNQAIGDLLISFEKLVGLQVITSAAEILGEVKGANIDTKSWQITELLVKLSNMAAEELNMKKRLGSSVVSIPVSVVQAVSHVVSLSKSVKDLENSREIIEYKEQKVSQNWQTRFEQ